MAAHLAVARVRKPHGLKGEVVVHLLTDNPETVLAVGKAVVPLTESGDPSGSALRISRSRKFQRQWLLQFEGYDARSDVEIWRQAFLGVPENELSPPANDELYVHEVPGCTVVADGNEVGKAVGLVELPAGSLLEVEVDGRTVMVPFREPILKKIDRGTRSIEIDPPDGLLDL